MFYRTTTSCGAISGASKINPVLEFSMQKHIKSWEKESVPSALLVNVPVTLQASSLAWAPLWADKAGRNTGSWDRNPSQSREKKPYSIPIPQSWAAVVKVYSLFPHYFDSLRKVTHQAGVWQWVIITLLSLKSARLESVQIVGPDKVMAEGQVCSSVSRLYIPPHR